MNYLLLTLSLTLTYIFCRSFDVLLNYILIKIGMRRQKQLVEKEIQRIQKYGEQEGFKLWK